MKKETGGNEIPAFLTELLYRQYGSAAENILRGYVQKRPVTLRANLLKTNLESVEKALSSLGFHCERAAVPFALIVTNASEEDLSRSAPYERGEIYLQSLSSMIPPFLLNAQEGESILDMTAAPGGKTCEISALTGGKAFLTACERDKIRFDRMNFNLKRQGVPHVNTICRDALMLDDFFRFDKILLDAPCSGSGTITVGERIKISEKLVQNSAILQVKLLNKALNLLKKGGILIYSTCSVLQTENEAVLQTAFKRGDCELVPPELPFDLPRLPSTPNTICIPPNELYEGFFTAILRKQ